MGEALFPRLRGRWHGPTGLPPLQPDSKWCQAHRRPTSQKCLALLQLLVKKQLGNGAYLEVDYDAKRRLKLVPTTVGDGIVRFGALPSRFGRAPSRFGDRPSGFGASPPCFAVLRKRDGPSWKPS